MLCAGHLCGSERVQIRVISPVSVIALTYMEPCDTNSASPHCSGPRAGGGPRATGARDRRTSPAPAPSTSRHDVVQRIRAIAPRFAGRAEAAEQARQIPGELVRELLDAGTARTLVPPRFGGYGLGFDTWFDVVQEISKADASHGWCAAWSSITPILSANSRKRHSRRCGQKAPMSQSQLRLRRERRSPARPAAIASRAAFRLCQRRRPQFVGDRRRVHQRCWSAGMDVLLIPQGEYEIRDTWFTAGMRGTGSNTIVTDNVLCRRLLRCCACRTSGMGRAQAARSTRTPSSGRHSSFMLPSPSLRRCWVPLRAPMNISENGRRCERRQMAHRSPNEPASRYGWPAPRPISTPPSCYCDVRRNCASRRKSFRPALLARSVRDFVRAAELTIAAIDTIIARSGTAGFATSHPIQRAWRDIHFASMHISLNTETNYAHFGRIELGLGRDPSQPFF